MKLPRALVAMVAVEIVVVFVHAGVAVFEPGLALRARILAIATGGTYAAIALALFGFHELARRAPARAHGLRLAAVGAAVTLALYAAWTAVTYMVVSRGDRELYDLYHYVAAVGPILVGVGLAIAARDTALGIAVVLASMLGVAPMDLLEKLTGPHYTLLATTAFGAIRTGAWVAVAYVCARDAQVPTPRPVDVQRGLRRASVGRWLALAGYVMALPLLYLFQYAPTPDSAIAVFELGQLVLLIAGLALLGWGLLDASAGETPELAPWPLLVAVVLAIGCAGVYLQAVLGPLFVLTSDSTHTGSLGSELRVLRMVAEGASAVGVLALVPLGRTRANGAGVAWIVYIVLAAAGLACTAWSEGDGALLLGTLALVVASAFAASAFARGADLVVAPALPPKAIVR